jgi:hypothetical protein
MYMNCSGYNEHSSPKYQHLDEQGTRDADTSQVPDKFFSFYFTNNLLQLDSMYMNCEGDDGHTPPIPTPG